jgi:nucleoside-diphosphate-sugar epimerase
MKVLFIGGTGIISSACSALAVKRGMELFLLTRGESWKTPAPKEARMLKADVRGEEEAVASALRGLSFDAVVDWTVFTPPEIERDIRLFTGRTRQFVFISSASAYQKPPGNYLITEDTPLSNPFWDYSRGKIACEERLMEEYRGRGFPAVIIRPSLTYGLSQIPLCVGSWLHPYTVIDRMKKGKKLIVPGDGTSLWTMTWNGDFAKGLVGLLGLERAVGQAFHITSDEVLSWNQIYLEAGRAAGAEPTLVHVPSELIAVYDPRAVGSLIGDKANSVVFDNSKIKSYVSGFSAEVRWSEGVRRAVAWHEEDPRRRTIDEEANAAWDAIIAAYERAFPA